MTKTDIHKPLVKATFHHQFTRGTFYKDPQHKDKGLITGYFVHSEQPTSDTEPQTHEHGANLAAARAERFVVVFHPVGKQATTRVVNPTSPIHSCAIFEVPENLCDVQDGIRFGVTPLADGKVAVSDLTRERLISTTPTRNLDEIYTGFSASIQKGVKGQDSDNNSTILSGQTDDIYIRAGVTPHQIGRVSILPAINKPRDLSLQKPPTFDRSNQQFRTREILPQTLQHHLNSGVDVSGFINIPQWISDRIMKNPLLHRAQETEPEVK